MTIRNASCLADGALQGDGAAISPTRKYRAKKEGNAGCDALMKTLLS